jgi:beta-phosphoglucomutase
VNDERPLAVFVDFNGVVVDDEALHRRCYAEVLEPLGLTLNEEEYFERFLGLDDRNFFQRFLTERGWAMEREGLEALLRKKSAAYARRAEEVRLCPGVAEFLRSVSARVPVAVVSGALRAEIESALARFGLAGQVSAVVAAEDVARGKPEPDGYLLGLQRLGSPPAERCLAFEDATAGIRAALAAGLDCWAVATNRPGAALQQASRVLSSLEGLDYGALRLAPERCVVAAVLETDKGLLLCRRPETGSEPGRWELPGGKVEPDETLAEALARELLEELRLRVEVGAELGRVRVGRTQMVFLETRLSQASEPSLHHYPEVAFVARPQIDSYDLLDADRRFLCARGG